jgi:hypothetical protein
VVILVEAETALAFVFLFNAHFVEVVPAPEHHDLLLVQDEVAVTMVADVVVRGIALQTEIVNDEGVSKFVFKNQVGGVGKDVFQVSFPLYLLLKSGLKLHIAHVLLSLLLKQIDDPLKTDVLRHPHHESLYPRKQESLEIL